ncbi:hypothetical protein TTHERM_00112500 (macronuclear) [Tetrahymena thermophila SB210]|uniref:Transmembrane protein n=1 Tax=Tetrahymena thermophila (strain SB210) TaxID=312017 RepID=Q22ZC1_TETTS|nr:hypothetical protein TTHERM_00112500 [Tetrahymena thermophila SB210]EAR90400.2 hypothetical protein TTHERM_00112500 [Tetrahymena thermophila SB210]|eukprot:XP_001010645.2 hypothetical protein TTHERM_00112500 [Tetrahymena thermophila SB210]
MTSYFRILMKFINMFLLISLYGISVKASQMLGSDVVMNYSNAQYMTQMSLKFQIVNALTTTDFVQFNLPFPLHSSLIADSNAPNGYQRPYALQALWSTFDPVTQVEGPQKIVQLFCFTSQSSTYLAQFLSGINQISPLVPGWYKIQFNIQDPSALNSQKQSQLLQVQTSTVSSIDLNAVQYDSNESHSFIYLDNQPASSLSLSISFDNPATQNQLSVQNLVYFDLTIDPTIIDQNDNKKFIIQLSDKSFMLTGTCQSVAKTSLPIINILKNTDYTCAVDNTNNQMVIILNVSALQIQTVFRFSVQVQNPDFVWQGVNVNVYALHQYSSTIIQIGNVPNAFYTNSLSIASHLLYLAWGMQDLPSLPMNMYAVRGSPPANPGYVPYNQINLRFKMKDAMPNSQEYRIIIQLNTDITSQLLTGSIIHNLPSFNNKNVVCREYDATNPSTRRLVCSQVSALQNSQEYFISFKMFFQFEVYQAWIDCSQFGTIQIQSMIPMTSNDNIFAISKDIKFINQMRDTSQASVVNTDNNVAFLQNLKSFSSIVLLVNAQDFTDYPNEVYSTSRPYTFSNKFTSYQDYFVPANNVDFINYILTNYPNIYIAQFPQTTTFQAYDITKTGNKYFTVQQTLPNNINRILTVNGKNWKQTGGDIVASSQLIGQTSSGFTFNPDATFGFQLSIGMQPLFSDVTANSYTGTAATQLPNNVGVLLMMNPLIKFQTPTVTNTQSTQDLSSAQGGYTCIQIQFKTEGQLSALFPNTASATTLTIKNMNLQAFSSSLNGYQTNLDIFIQTIDGIAGPQNTQTRNAYVLVNGYYLSSSALPGISVGVANFYTSSASGIDGSMVPAILRINGQLSNPSQKIVVFFDNLSPLYFNQSQDLVACSSTLPSLTTAECKVYVSQNPNVLAYFQMSRFEITVQSPSSSTNFQVIIPLAIPANQVKLTLYLGTINSNSAVTYVKPIPQFSYTLQGSALAPFQAAGTSSYNYGISCSSCKAGDTQDPLTINASHSGNAPNPNAAATDVGAGFTFVADYPFYNQQSSAVTNTPAQFGTCILFLYRFSSATRYGLFCPLNGAVPSTPISVSKCNLPQLPIVNAYGAYSDKTGAIYSLQLNTNSNSILNPATIASPTQLPSIDSSQTGYAISFTIQTPTDLPQTFVVQITNAANLQLTSRAAYQTCMSTILTTTSVCAIQNPTSLQTLQFLITVKGGQILKGTSIQIILYGLVTATNGSDINTATIQIMDSTAATTYSQILNQSIKFNSLVAPNPPTTPGVYATGFDASSITQSNLNINGRTQLSFNLYLHSKYLYSGERIQIQFDTFSSVNVQNLGDLRCLVYYVNPNPNAPPVTNMPLTNDIYSLQFQQISNVLTLNIIFKVTGYMKERNYAVQCYNFNVPAVASSAIDFKFFALPTLTPSVSQNQLFPVGPATLQKSSPALSPAMQTSLPTSKVTKQYSTPGSSLELIFEIGTANSVISQTSRVLVYFPNYYPRLLSRDGNNLFCLQSDTLVISCSVLDIRLLEIKYFPQQVNKGGVLKFTISGVIQPLNYSVGSFLVAIDDDNSNGQLNEYIVLQDNPVQQDQLFLKGSLFVQSATISSTYLLQNGASYSFQIYLSSSMDSINYGQFVIVNFPQIFAQQLSGYTNPVCSITLLNSPEKDYSGACLSYGLRIKIKVNELMTSGAYYVISINNIYNPSVFGPQFYKWIIEVGDNNQQFIVYKSFASTSNYVDYVYSISPQQQLLNFADASGNPITQIVLMQGVISNPIFIQRQLSTAYVFARSFTLVSLVDQILTLPLKPTVQVGTQSSSFQLFASNAIGKYNLQLQKLGDGEFYANLPTLSVVFDATSSQVIAFNEQPLMVDISTSVIYLSLATLLPVSDVSITFSVPNTNTFTGFVLDPQKSTLRFTPAVSSGTLPFTLSSPPAVGTTINLSMVISGTNAASYSIPTNPLQIQFIAQDSTTLAVSVSSTPSTTSPTTAVLSAQCGKAAQFYWGISVSYSSDTTKCAITQKQVISTLQDSINDIQLCFYQFGQVYIKGAQTATINLTNLRVNSQYRIYGLCQDGSNNQSFTTNPVTMTTSDNSGQVMKLTIDFDAAPTMEQRQKILCFLTLFFQVQPLYLKSFDGTYCQELNQSNRRRVRLLQANQQAQLNCAESSTDLPIITQPNLFTQTFYFGKAMNVDNDQVATQLLSATKKACFKTYFQSNLQGIPNVINIYKAIQIQASAPSQSQSPVTFVGNNWSYFEMQLKQNGLIYMIIDSSGGTPTSSQVIQGVNSLSKPALAQASIAVDTLINPSGNFTFAPLTAGQSYTIYYVLSNENPFPDQSIFSSVQNIQVTATAIPIDSFANTLKFQLILVSIILVTFV